MGEEKTKFAIIVLTIANLFCNCNAGALLNRLGQVKPGTDWRWNQYYAGRQQFDQRGCKSKSDFK